MCYIEVPGRGGEEEGRKEGGRRGGGEEGGEERGERERRGRRRKEERGEGRGGERKKEKRGGGERKKEKRVRGAAGWRLYLLSCGLEEGKLGGGDGQVVSEEADIPGALEREDVWSWAVPPSNTTQQLPLSGREGEEGGRERDGWRGGEKKGGVR